MHDGEGEENNRRPQRRHMLQSPRAGPVASPALDLKQDSTGFFVKDGRKIRVGDSALFQSGNAPPFIGLIRWFNADKEFPKLGVNWLYRQTDIKLSKGVLLEAAPNEVFYSFHRDEIPAASLLHPCKVAFLQKGVELPAGISSFVCRRVYDVSNKRLWWLTDQDYINEHQEEVDQLLDKTQLEMHAAVQSGGRSPKPSNVSSPTQQLKSVSDGAQNSATSFPQQGKSKKKERSETEPIRRERSLKVEDVDSASLKLDSMIKSEIAKITDKGGLMNIEAVEKLVHLMQVDRGEKKLDLGGRVLLADVISSTEKDDCLGRFVLLRGVSVFDEWLQEAHRGKAGDGSSPKESDKYSEELVLALLRALDKLPVNLNALQTCNIGKSVNQLRGHKNLEIQKKARSLVETWKKRVNAEMAKINDSKSASSCQSVSWPAKQGFTEVSHVGNKRPSSTELVTKDPTTQPSACKSLPSKPSHLDAITKSSPAISGSPKTSSQSPVPLSCSSKDTVSKTTGSIGMSDVPLTAVKEEKSSSSSQSQNNSQSCSGDHLKTASSSYREDARNLPTGSVIPSKTSGGTSRHRRSTNGLIGTSSSGSQKETNVSKSGSLNRTTMMDKAGLTCERQPDTTIADQGNSHRLIVRLPNPGRSPARSASGGSFEDPSTTGSRGSSPGIADKIDHIDRTMKVNGDTCQANISAYAHIDPWHSVDSKEGIAISDEGVKPHATYEDKPCKNIDENGKLANVSRTSSSSLGNEKEFSPHKTKMRNSFSSMNALIESCENEANASLSAGDVIGMNLLASVAAGELPKRELVSPPESPEGSPAIKDNEAKPRLKSENLLVQRYGQISEDAADDSEMHEKSAHSLLGTDEQQHTANSASGDDKSVITLTENKLADQCNGVYIASTGGNDVINSDGNHQHGEEAKTTGQVNDSLTDCKSKVRNPALDEKRPVAFVVATIADDRVPDLACNTSCGGCDIQNAASVTKPEKMDVEDFTCASSSLDVPNQEPLRGGEVSALTEQQQPPLMPLHSAAIDTCGDASVSSGAENVQCLEKSGVFKAEKSNSSKGRNPSEPGDTETKERINLHSTTVAHPRSASAGEGHEDVSERKEVAEQSPSGSSKFEASSTTPALESEQSAKSTGSKVSGSDAARSEEQASTEASLALNAGLDCTSKVDFDLNEGFLGDDGQQSEPVAVPISVSSSAINLPGLSHFAQSSMRSGSPVPVTVAAPAKGPFVPPENLLKSKTEPGWKGSAATSAFRPAEPRKVLEMPLSTTDAPLPANSAGKQIRPALDIDLNVPDERVLEDVTSQSSAQTTGSESGVVSNREVPMRMVGGLDLDLNKIDEGSDNGIFLANTSRRFEVPPMPVRPSKAGLANGNVNSLRDFDLNGPSTDEAGAEFVMHHQQAKNVSPIASLRMSKTDVNSTSSWFSPGNSYPAVAIPSFLHDRGEHPFPIVAAPGAQRISGSATSNTSYGADIYRHPGLTSSPAMAFSHTSFPYAGFHYGSSYPVASNSFPGVPSTYGDSTAGAGPCFPTMPSQIMGPAASLSSHYNTRPPYVISLPESSTNSGAESSRKWSIPGLDLNAGPGSVDVDARGDRLSSAPRQLSIASSQAFVEEQQSRIFPLAGGSLKRKEPEGGWDAERFAYKHPPWP
ncbi:BAH domain proteins protein [Dioscorea alata]|uniref:BAH domain proteins protein n=1 Tax=Dioscorea alata TaxID=55571 RepID=A0ACB7W9K3_DIOAL|nr:BAH domain proteins protein [Dioscorea alata]